MSVALIFLMIAVGAELTGPFIGKKMIDDHILGVEKPYVEVNEKTDKTVYYQGNNYIRSDRLNNGMDSGKQINVVQVGFGYYFVNEPIRFDGNRKISGDQLTIDNGNERETYEVQRLSKRGDFRFLSARNQWFGAACSILSRTAHRCDFLSVWAALFAPEDCKSNYSKMRVDVFEHIQTLPIRYFDNLPAGKVVARITNDTETIRDLYVTVLANFVTSAIYMIGIYIAMFFVKCKAGTHLFGSSTDYFPMVDDLQKVCISVQSPHSFDHQ
ncbi:hypothetical protein BsIDN1_18020 [Bacillus safensis]|uniref:ABC transmembrane type-1 domain-containing protein n=1 Tax=Bacillus safensis TaxID=561879 RepID=A0A5S9M7P1_BACIA|nr:hypothetical protein BsIDN1_18020 [Bacillus safensis]